MLRQLANVFSVMSLIDMTVRSGTVVHDRILRCNMRYHYQETEPEGSLTADFEDLGTQIIRCGNNHNGVLCVVSNDGHP